MQIVEKIDPKLYFQGRTTHDAFWELMLAGIYYIDWDNKLDAEYHKWQAKNTLI